MGVKKNFFETNWNFKCKIIPCPNKFGVLTTLTPKRFYFQEQHLVLNNFWLKAILDSKLIIVKKIFLAPKNLIRSDQFVGLNQFLPHFWFNTNFGSQKYLGSRNLLMEKWMTILKFHHHTTRTSYWWDIKYHIFHFGWPINFYLYFAIKKHFQYFCIPELCVS